ncbi:MAG: V-type ATP synthase subunit F [Elusimicrobiales bacterium]|nr:V-type ATP synthase subunit F [Elusimicrobiales bacterium]
MEGLRFYCIGDEDTARGFRLAGVEGSAVSGAEETAAALEAAAARADCGVIIMTRAAAELAREKVEEIKHERARPLIVEI